MKHIEEYRDPELAKRLQAAIAEAMSRSGNALRFMEVCGTHTMAIGRHGLRQLFPANLQLISGPGCPVCVTPTAEVDQAIDLARRPGVLLASFGDMLRVPGSQMSLAQARAEGAGVELVYSAVEALQLAKSHPRRQVIFLGVGFETTSPTVAASLLMARAGGLGNFSVLSCFKLLPPALHSLLDSGDLGLQGFLLPGHISSVIGARAFSPLVVEYRLACVVGGFEPVDIMGSVLMLIKQCLNRDPDLQIQYQRAAGFEGSRRALEALAEVFEPCDSQWRGLGLIPQSGLALRAGFQQYDAARRFGLTVGTRLENRDPPGCQCGNVLRGLLSPPQCSLFAKRCTPQSPVGPCMVSGEGSCAAYYRYEHKP